MSNREGNRGAGTAGNHQDVAVLRATYVALCLGERNFWALKKLIECPGKLITGRGAIM
ncbi:MAG: hypothetical protein VYE04_00160 [Pseudomonadota bacterium]|nr:hypothetical protein [Pseudomonadota bacterium]